MPADPDDGHRQAMSSEAVPSEAGQQPLEAVDREPSSAPRRGPAGRAERGGPGRRLLVGALVALFAVLLPVTAAAAWTHRTVLDTDHYVSTLAPIAADPAVIAAVSREITNEIYVALDPQATIAGALPPKAAFLASPIANAARSR